MFGIDIKPRTKKVFDTSLFAETPKPATIVSGLFNEGAPKKTNSLFDESPEKKGKNENKDKKGVTTLFDESTPKAKKHLFDDNYDMPIKPATVKKQKKNLFDDEPEKPAQKKSMKIIKKPKKTLFDDDEDYILSKAKPKKEETKKELFDDDDDLLSKKKEAPKKAAVFDDDDPMLMIPKRKKGVKEKEPAPVPNGPLANKIAMFQKQNKENNFEEEITRKREGKK